MEVSKACRLGSSVLLATAHAYLVPLFSLVQQNSGTDGEEATNPAKTLPTPS